MPRGLFFPPGRCRRKVPPKHLYLCSILHGVTSQKTAILSFFFWFLSTDVKTCVFFLRIQKPFAQFDMLYDKPWTRVGPYLVGMATGWMLCRTKCTLKMSPVSKHYIVQPSVKTDSQSELEDQKHHRKYADIRVKQNFYKPGKTILSKCVFISVSFHPNFMTCLLYCIVVGSRRLMPPDALQPKAFCTNPGL